MLLTLLNLVTIAEKFNLVAHAEAKLDSLHNSVEVRAMHETTLFQ